MGRRPAGGGDGVDATRAPPLGCRYVLLARTETKLVASVECGNRHAMSVAAISTSTFTITRTLLRSEPLSFMYGRQSGGDRSIGDARGHRQPRYRRARCDLRDPGPDCPACPFAVCS